MRVRVRVRVGGVRCLGYKLLGGIFSGFLNVGLVFEILGFVKNVEKGLWGSLYSKILFFM